MLDIVLMILLSNRLWMAYRAKNARQEARS